jgi:hypothetical protein
LFNLRKIVIAAVLSTGGLVLLGTQSRIVFAKGEQGPVASERSHAIAQGEDAAKQLLLLMDRDKSGKVSRAEFMSFMEAEFNRLDKDKSGELDVKELEQSQFKVREVEPFSLAGK